MDKITHQVRIEHWTKIMNACLNSGMNKTACCRANGISDKQFFHWQRILRKEASEELSVIPASKDESCTPQVSFTEISLPIKQEPVGNEEFLSRYPIPFCRNSCQKLECCSMLNNASGFQKIFLVTGYTDLRRGYRRARLHH